MRLLLDTHIWLWSHLEPERLAPPVAAALEDRDNELWLSPLSLWEVLTLSERGRLSLVPDTEAWIAAALRHAPMQEAPLTHDVALATTAVTLDHRDPVDRFLAATARALELTLVTADARLIAGSGFEVLANR